MTAFNQRKLERSRRPDLEAAMHALDAKMSPKGDVRFLIGGDIVIGPKSAAKSMRFTFSEYDKPGGGVEVGLSLSAQGHTRCTDVDVRRFCKYAEVTILQEEASEGISPYVRSFMVKP